MFSELITDTFSEYTTWPTKFEILIFMSSDCEVWICILKCPLFGLGKTLNLDKELFSSIPTFTPTTLGSKFNLTHGADVVYSQVPASEFKIDVQIDYNSKVLQVSSAQLNSLSDFNNEISCQRFYSY